MFKLISTFSAEEVILKIMVTTSNHSKEGFIFNNKTKVENYLLLYAIKTNETWLIPKEIIDGVSTIHIGTQRSKYSTFKTKMFNILY